MPGDLHYAHEKYDAARSTLADTDGPLAERLIDAYISQAMHASPLKPGLGPAIDEDTADRIERLNDRVTAVPGPDGSITTTIRGMDPEELRDTVRELLSIARALDEAYFASLSHRHD